MSEHWTEGVTPAQVHDDPVAAADRALRWATEHDELLVHVDIGALSRVDLPVAENSRRRDGLRLDELAAVLA